MSIKISGVFPALIFAGVGGTLLSLSISPVFAQGASASAGSLEEIVVVARRREESLMDTPVSITAFTAQDLQDRQIFRSHQIADSTPNLVYRNNDQNSSMVSIIFIRGIGQTDFVPSRQPGVGIYIDDAYVASSIGSVSEILDLESIEVLRGPQGTLFGRNTIGGAILLNTKKPNDVFAGEVEVQVGENEHKMAKAIVNVPLTDTFYAKIAAMYREKDGWVDTPNIEGDRGLGSEEATVARLSLRWLASDAVTIDAYADGSNRKSDGQPAVILAYNETTPVTEIFRWNNIMAPTLNALYGLDLGLVTNELYVPGEGELVNYTGQRTPADTDVFNVGITLAWDISDNLRFKSITNYREMEGMDGLDSDGSPVFLQRLTGFHDSEQFTQEFQLSGTVFDDRMDWLIGAYHFQEESQNSAGAIFTRFSLLSGSKVDNKSDAFFGQLTYDLSDSMTLTLGARYTDERLDSIVDDSIQYITELYTPTCSGPCTAQPAPSPIDGRDIWARRGGMVGYRPFPAPPDPGACK